MKVAIEFVVRATYDTDNVGDYPDVEPSDYPGAEELACAMAISDLETDSAFTLLEFADGKPEVRVGHTA